MPSFLQDLFGTKPTVPTLPTLDLGTEAGKSIAANQANLEAGQKLVSQTNQFSIDQITRMLNETIPGYSKISSTVSGDISDLAAGKVPKDVEEELQNLDAGKALAGGYGGSGMHGDLLARDLGLTSLDLVQKGITSAEQWTRTMASLYEPSQINLSSMFVTPQQEASFDVNQQESQFQRNWMANQVSAMPNPEAVGIFNLVSGLGLGLLGHLGTTGGVAGGGGFSDAPGVESTGGGDFTNAALATSQMSGGGL